MRNGPRSLVFRLLHDVLRRDGASLAWADALRYERTPVDRQGERRISALRHLSCHAVVTVPYFRDQIGVSPEEIRRWGISEFRALPLLDKPIIRAQGERMLAEGREALKPISNATSGSTGESLQFWNDGSKAVYRRAATYRFFAWCGVSPFEREAKLWGARFDAPSRRGATDRLRDWLHPGLFLSSYRMSDDDLEANLRALQEFQPRILTSYPSPLARFAEFCSRRGESIPSLRSIITSAEQLREDQRSTIEAALGVRIFNRYGSREFGNLAQQCEVHGGLHVATDRVWLEILDAQGRECAPGEVGEVVVTDYHNEVMPFLRYRTGDLASWAEAPCDCGRTLPTLEGLEGRILDLIRTPSGRVISGTFWPQAVKEASRRVQNFQVRQVSLDRIDVIVQTEAAIPLPEAEQARLRNRIQEFAPDLRVDIQTVGDIAPTRAGKTRQVVNLVDADPRSSNSSEN